MFKKNIKIITFVALAFFGAINAIAMINQKENIIVSEEKSKSTLEEIINAIDNTELERNFATIYDNLKELYDDYDDIKNNMDEFFKSIYSFFDILKNEEKKIYKIKQEMNIKIDIAENLIENECSKYERQTYEQLKKLIENPYGDEILKQRIDKAKEIEENFRKQKKNYENTMENTRNRLIQLINSPFKETEDTPKRIEKDLNEIKKQLRSALNDYHTNPKENLLLERIDEIKNDTREKIKKLTLEINNEFKMNEKKAILRKIAEIETFKKVITNTIIRLIENKFNKPQDKLESKIIEDKNIEELKKELIAFKGKILLFEEQRHSIEERENFYDEILGKINSFKKINNDIKKQKIKDI